MGYSTLDKTDDLRDACNEIISGILDGRITRNNFENEKLVIARSHEIGKIIKNVEIFQFVDKNDKNYELLKNFFKTKPIRTSSGVANISVMWIGPGEKYFSCPGSCIYCPQGTAPINGTMIPVPKSYTGSEPTTMRAVRNNYDPYLQVANRLKQLHIIGHSTDKCELIIMGGTFTAMPFEFQENFVKNCLDAMNNQISDTLEKSQAKNESAENRCIGLTIETRADFCSKRHVDEMLELGCTRLELGVQSTSDEILERINRGHGTNENKKAIELLKKSGLKVTAHWMPGLTGLFGEIDEKKEIELFKQLFSDPSYRIDELKIYPVLVLPNTGLYELWKSGKYHPLTKEQAIDLLIEIKKIVPRYVRIKRIMRDISEHESEAGASTTNLRQLAKIRMGKLDIKCNCIRCREVGLNNKKPENASLIVDEYDASGGREFFISYEDVKNSLLLGFARLRIDNETARIRELHVYGESTPIGHESIHTQHRGVGKMLMAKAEEIAHTNGCEKIFVTSGIGVRDYYKKLGYAFDGIYMAKNL
ncbi:tRNA uridine(34) 5-carboxymethylaminomethyl modification radical SAM/GNAT enzyme Elp3 [archaeon]|nr:tRNA uridine(34) 5-carboxymethylaminomethyl modification radical SAM/GNAT enzyme Elp3 [archaeon]